MRSSVNKASTIIRPRCRRRSRRARRGLLASEMIMGLMLMVAVATVLAAMMTRRAVVTQRFAETRAAQQLAEAVLLDLQSHRPPALPKDDPAIKVEVQPVTDAAPVGEARWVRVEVTHDGRQTSLVGLVPAGASTQPAAR